MTREICACQIRNIFYYLNFYISISLQKVFNYIKIEYISVLTLMPKQVMDIQLEINHLKIQVDNYKSAINLITEMNFSELTSVIGPMLVVNETSLRSMILLAENEHYRDLIILSRPFLESVLNIGFICADEEAMINSKKYAYQKGYRDFFRDIEVNGFKMESTLSKHKSKFEEAMPNQMREALSDFTTKSGKEMTSWTPETAKAKLEVIGKVYGDYVNGLLSFAFFSIYRDVSEIIHNTYYGVLIFIGMQQKDISFFKSSEEAAEFFEDHQKKLAILIIQQINISSLSMINILRQKFNTEQLNKLYEKSNSDLLDYTSKINDTMV